LCSLCARKDDLKSTSLVISTGWYDRYLVTRQWSSVIRRHSLTISTDLNKTLFFSGGGN
jgi:hypothetical protein